jgi:hypothetical protein
MNVAVSSRPKPIPIALHETVTRRDFEPNWGPDDVHAVRAVAYLMNGIFLTALVMYSTITIFAWIGS